MAVRPLESTRVVSLAQEYLVERPDGGDPARRFPEFFAAVNRGKRSVALPPALGEHMEEVLARVAV